VIKTLFEMDRAELPDAIVGAFERNGPRLAAKGHMNIDASPVTRKDDGMAIKYATSFPYADLVFRINGKGIKASAFGLKGKIIKIKPFLEGLIKPGLENLKKAAKGEGAVSAHIKKAAHYRIISRAISLTATTQKKKAIFELKKHYPIGIRTQALQALIQLSDKAIANITRKTRYIGLTIGLGLSALLYTGLFIGGVYAPIGAHLTQSLELALSIGLIVAGGFLSLLAINMAAKRSIKNTLGHLLPADHKTKTTVKYKSSGLYAFLGSALIFILIIAITRQSGLPVPGWYPF